MREREKGLSLAQNTLAEWTRDLAGPRPTPAGGALALVSLAGAAALATKLARLLNEETRDLEEHAPWFLAAAEEDTTAYRRASRGGEGRRRCLEAQRDHLERALGLLDRVDGLFEKAPPALAADVTAAERIARAAARGLLLNLAVNLALWADETDGLEPIAAELEGLRARLGAP